MLAYGQIFSAVWNEDYVESAYESVRGLVKRLRKKIAEADINGNQINIENKWGVGYKLPLDNR